MPAQAIQELSDNIESARILPPIKSRQPKLRRQHKTRFTAREEAFITAMLAGDDRTTAATKAGYAQHNIAVTAYKLVNKGKIKAALAQRMEALGKTSVINAPYVVETIKAEIEHLRSNPERSASASQAIFRGTELLGKTIGLYTDRVEEDRHITVTIERIG